MKMYRLLPALAAACLLLAPTVHAQADYPQKPIRIVVPFPAGGYSDLLGRLLAQDMTQSFGQSAVVDNRPGAGGNIGAEIVAKSAPDGYTLVMGTIGTHAINGALYEKISFDAQKDFAPIGFVADAETVLVVNPAVPVRTTKELIALAKAKPDALSYASAGPGTTSHLAGELFKSVTGAPMVHVPYKGNSQAMTDLVAGQVSLSFATLQTALPFIKSGKLVALATLGSTRAHTLAEVPTLEEQGFRGFEVRNWTGLFAPAGTPEPVITKLYAEVDKVMRSPAVQAKLESEGLKYTPMDPREFAAFTKAETVKWTKIVKSAHVRVD